MALPSTLSSLLPLLLLLLILNQVSLAKSISRESSSSLKEATLAYIHQSFRQNNLTSRQLVQFYIGEIRRLNPRLSGVIEMNPDALQDADKADNERRANSTVLNSMLHGVPILLKDNIATKDKMSTTAGSYALLGSVVPRDAGVVTKLRNAGAIILGKASLSQWAGFRSLTMPPGWSSRGGQGVNPYNSTTPCGSSSGSAISVAANMAAVTLGTETDGSILCPSSYQSVVGIKPTVGLTSRAGVIPITLRQDTVGPICRTVSDAVHVLDAIVGVDQNDNATSEASKYIPKGGYAQYLKSDGFRGKRIGIVRDFFGFTNGSFKNQTSEQHFNILRQGGAVLVDNLILNNLSDILNPFVSGEFTATKIEFKVYLNAYLKELVTSNVRSLADVINFNKINSTLESNNIYGQDIFESAQNTTGFGNEYQAAVSKLASLTTNGFQKLMDTNNLDALVTPGDLLCPVLAIGGFPGINVPAAFDNGEPVGVTFGGLKGSEPKLIQIAYAFEQATNIRKPPPLNNMDYIPTS